MVEYRLKKDTHLWHWAHACSKWPTYDYEVHRGEPTWGEKCEECKQKQQPDEAE